MISRLALFAALVAVFALFSGCSKDDNKSTTNNNNTTVNLKFVGTVNGSSGSMTASITLIVNGTTVTGTLHVTAPSAATIDLTGSYNTSTKAVSATGGGYTFAGTYDGSNRCDGNMSGTSTGTFVSVKDDSSTAIAFCGSFTGDDDGIWNFTVNGTTLTGTYTTTGNNTGALNGTLSGNNITIARPGGGNLAVGTISGTNASGTWDDGAGNNGTWTGSKCN